DHGDKSIQERNTVPFRWLHDFKRRVSLTKEELRSLAELGALNCFAEHRRSALWRIEESSPEPLFADLIDSAHSSSVNANPPLSGCGESTEGRDQEFVTYLSNESPLRPMTLPERVKADYD